MGSRAGLDSGEGRNIVTLPEFELRGFSLKPSRYAKGGEEWKMQNVRLQTHGGENIVIVKLCTYCKIRSFHGGEYEEHRLLGCGAL
jgi:hypothetical protein